MENIAPALLEWFYKNQRILPFRTDPSPYHVWLSEIMLQQTRVSAALPYYERFLAALPDIPALAACEEEKPARTKAEKKAIEDARYVLPNACETKMILTMNVRSLRNFFRLRCCNRAQWEIREVATEMLRLCCEVSPALFRTAGPSCYCGGCAEGKMSCGKAKEVREKFEVIHGETR